MGAMSALEDAGVRIPEDISVIGIDSISFAFLALVAKARLTVPASLENFNSHLCETSQISRLK